MILCASELGFAFGAGVPRIVGLAGDAGFEGIAVGPGCGHGDLAPLIAAAISAGLVVPVVAAPLGDGPPGPGRRLPYLASIDDGDERRAALALFNSTLEASVPFGVRLIAVNLGEVPVSTPVAEVARRFARRELEEDEPGARVWAAAIGERRARSGAFLDACRTALDRVLPVAERRDVVLAVEIAGDPWGGPSPRETLTLLDEYRDGPIAVVWDEARMQVLGAFGIAPSPERGAALGAAARIWRANDSVGIEVGYLPGLGDPGARSDRPALVPIAVTGRPDSRPDEVARARLQVAESRKRPDPG